MSPWFRALARWSYQRHLLCAAAISCVVEVNCWAHLILHEAIKALVKCQSFTALVPYHSYTTSQVCGLPRWRFPFSLLFFRFGVLAHFSLSFYIYCNSTNINCSSDLKTLDICTCGVKVSAYCKFLNNILSLIDHKKHHHLCVINYPNSL